MSGKTQVSLLVSPLRPLTVNDRLMFQHYFSNGQNATRAYLAVHPNAKYTTAESNGHKWLRKAKIQAEVQRRLQYEHGITREHLERDLLWCADQARAKQDYEALASITMDCAKLAGFLIDKRQELAPAYDHLSEDDIWSELERRMKAKEKMSDNKQTVKQENVANQLVPQ